MFFVFYSPSLSPQTKEGAIMPDRKLRVIGGTCTETPLR